MIQIDDLFFEYPGHQALRGVSLRIEPGSVTALVGPNGAGKSTLMRCMAGLLRPLNGQIRVNGVDVLASPREAHRHLGYLSDFFGLYDQLRVRQCLAHAARATGVPAAHIETRVQEVARALDLSALLERLPTELSRGQRQRVAIAQAIIHQPRVLLLDEPASGLDPEARSSLSGLFRHLQAGGMTLLVSSHILSELDEYSTHLLSLREGRVVQHEALGLAAAATSESGAAGNAANALYTLELAGNASAWRATINTVLSQLTLPLCDASETLASTVLTLSLPSQAAASRAQTLAALIAAGVPVAGLWPVRSQLQARYAQGGSPHQTPAPEAAHRTEGATA